VDEFFVKVKNQLIALVAKDGEHSEAYIDLLMIAKYLERIGDHAQNIAEWVEYYITGKRGR
jgi:phosphate transport system protein